MLLHLLNVNDEIRVGVEKEIIHNTEEQGQFSLEGQVWQHSHSKLHEPAAYNYRQSGGFWLAIRG
jgi:hypothetical protein